MKEFPQVHYGWVKRFNRLHEIMESDIIYMDVINRVRGEISAKDRILEIRINNIPYPEIPYTELAKNVDISENLIINKFKREQLDWMGSSIELCVISAFDPENKTFVDIWEPCAFAAVMTVTGSEVMVATKQRNDFSLETASLLTRSLNKNFTHDSLEKDKSYPYMEFRKLLSRGISSFEKNSEQKTDPPIREKTFQIDRKNHIKDIVGDGLW